MDQQQSNGPSPQPPTTTTSRTARISDTLGQVSCGPNIFRSLSSCGPSILAAIHKKPPPRVYHVPPLHELPEALATIVLTFLTARNICLSIRKVDRLWRIMSHENGLWKMLCQITGKAPVMPDCPSCPWQMIYIGNPLVPVDVPKISDAVKFTSACKNCC